MTPRRLCLAFLAGFLALHLRCYDSREEGAPVPAPRDGPPGPSIAVKVAEGPELRIELPAAASLTAAGADPPAALGRLEGGARTVSAAGGRIRLDEIETAGPIEIRLLGPGDLAFLDPGRPGGEMLPCRGSFRLDIGGGRLVLSNILPLEEYLDGVVAAEMPASAYPMEALKAQAVASRTYALYALLRAREQGLRRPFAADQRFQVYGGRAREHRRAVEAVRATRGEVLLHEGALFRSYFHASCGGRTTDAARLFGEPPIEPLLGAVCGACDGSPSFRWSARIARADLELALGPWAASRGVPAAPLDAIEVSDLAPDGRVSYIRVRHRKGAYEIHAEALRKVLGKAIRSAAFEVVPAGDGWQLEGRGHGHGAGLCQTGAAGRAASASHAEILAAYYPGSRIEKVY